MAQKVVSCFCDVRSGGVNSVHVSPEHLLITCPLVWMFVSFGRTNLVPLFSSFQNHKDAVHLTVGQMEMDALAQAAPV